jgi:hypothetical protein
VSVKGRTVIFAFHGRFGYSRSPSSISLGPNPSDCESRKQNRVSENSIKEELISWVLAFLALKTENRSSSRDFFFLEMGLLAICFHSGALRLFFHFCLLEVLRSSFEQNVRRFRKKLDNLGMSGRHIIRVIFLFCFVCLFVFFFFFLILFFYFLPFILV